MIPTDVVHAVRDALPPSQVISRTVRLRRAGRAWKGLCPFHKEKTPSFTVDDQRGTWHCFGCGEGGDVIEFVRQAHGWTFNEAVEELAKVAGITIPPPSAQHAKQQARRLGMLEVLERARLYYQQQLERAPQALAYLKRRGVSDDAIAAFGIGWAPAGIEGLATAVGTRAGTNALASAGLVVAATGAPYLRDRIVLPIADLRSRTVAFAGRTLADDVQPKYLNTPETDVFHKGATLYGASIARQKAHDGEPLAVVEGYLDVIACWQAGIPAVASMGTSLTELQLQQLWRLSDRPTLAYDGDAAGRVATRRALVMGLTHLAPGVTLQAVQLRQGADPGHYLTSGGAEKLRALLGAPSGLADAFWLASTAGAGEGPGGRGQLEADMTEALSKIPNPQLRAKYLADMRARINSMARPRRVVRSNGYTHHSTNPATKRLLGGVCGSGMSLRDAVVLSDIARDPEQAMTLTFNAALQPTVDAMVALAIDQPGIDWSGTSVASTLDEARSVMAAVGLAWGTSDGS